MKIILFRGRPGGGKTTLSIALAKHINLPILRKDDIYDVIVPFMHEHSARNKITYNTLWNILESNKENDCSFILDYPFQEKDGFKTIKEWCAIRNVSLKSILVTCSDEQIWVKRFEERAKNPAPHQLITNFYIFKEMYGSMQIDPETEELLIDTVIPIEDSLQKIIDFL